MSERRPWAWSHGAEHPSSALGEGQTLGVLPATVRVRASLSDQLADERVFELIPNAVKKSRNHGEVRHHRLRAEACSRSGLCIVITPCDDPLDGMPGYVAALALQGTGEVVEVIEDGFGTFGRARLAAHEAWGGDMRVRRGIACEAVEVVDVKEPSTPEVEAPRPPESVHCPSPGDRDGTSESTDTDTDRTPAITEAIPTFSNVESADTLRIVIAARKAGRARWPRFTVRLEDASRTCERLRGTFATFGLALQEASRRYGTEIPVIETDADGKRWPWPFPQNPPSANTEGSRLVRERLVNGPLTALPPEVEAYPRWHPAPINLKYELLGRAELACYCETPKQIAVAAVEQDALSFYCRDCRRWFDSALFRGLLRNLRSRL